MSNEFLGEKMKSLSNAGLIIAALILSAGLMFMNSKDSTAWMFMIVAGYLFYNTIKDEDEKKD